MGGKEKNNKQPQVTSYMMSEYYSGNNFPDLNATELAFLAKLIRHWSPGRMPNPGITSIAQALNISVRHAKRVKKSLVRKKEVIKVRNSKTSCKRRNHTSVYILDEKAALENFLKNIQRKREEDGGSDIGITSDARVDKKDKKPINADRETDYVEGSDIKDEKGKIIQLPINADEKRDCSGGGVTHDTGVVSSTSPKEYTKEHNNEEYSNNVSTLRHSKPPAYTNLTASEGSDALEKSHPHPALENTPRELRDSRKNTDPKHPALQGDQVSSDLESESRIEKFRREIQERTTLWNSLHHPLERECLVCEHYDNGFCEVTEKEEGEPLLINWIVDAYIDRKRDTLCPLGKGPLGDRGEKIQNTTIEDIEEPPF